jgi:hypothetical protein
MSWLKSLTFESGSKLREIQSSVFDHCASLKSIFLPASLSTLSWQAFLSSSIEEVIIDAANPHYFASGRFLVAVDGMRLIRSFGRGDDLNADSLCKLGLRKICPNAFSNCSALKSICIPASIEIIGKECFENCSSLSQIIFQSGSRITRLGGEVFGRCSLLTSICIPANVKSIGAGCLCKCRSLVEVSFEPGSKLTRIECEAFIGCISLPSFVIPAQLEVIAHEVFSGCRSLCELIFADPSHLKQLDLPPSAFGSLSIPNCVEVVSGAVGAQQGQGRLLHFGEQSCSKDISLGQSVTPWRAAHNSELGPNVFLCLPEMTLRIFRSKFEEV